MTWHALLHALAGIVFLLCCALLIGIGPAFMLWDHDRYWRRRYAEVDERRKAKGLPPLTPEEKR